MATKREQERDIAYKRIIGQLNDQSVYENVMRSCSRMIDLQHIDNVLAACSQKPYATALNTYILKSEEELKRKNEVFLAASIIVYERLEVDCNNEKSQLASVVRGFQPDDIYYVLDKAHSISRGLIQNIRMELQEIRKERVDNYEIGRAHV